MTKIPEMNNFHPVKNMMMKWDTVWDIVLSLVIYRTSHPVYSIHDEASNILGRVFIHWR